MPVARGKYRPAEKVGAHLALLLNTADKDGQVTIKPFELWRRLNKLLALNSNYKRPLLGESDAANSDAEQTAAKWIDLVLDGLRQTHAGRLHHAGHKLIEHFSNRVSDFAPAQLGRGDAAQCAAADGAARVLKEHLEHWQADRPAIRHRDGPALLSLRQSEAVVLPEGLSLWGATRCAHPKLSRLSSDDELEFVHFMARAVHGANKHWEMLVQLNLHPPEWLEHTDSDGPLETLGTNQARLAIKFVRRAQQIAGPEPQVADWQQAWKEAPISKTMEFETFAQTIVGRHLMSHSMARDFRVDFDVEQVAQDEEAALASVDDSLAALDQIEQDGLVEEQSLDILRAVLGGQSLKEIYETNADLIQQFSSFESFLDHSDNVADQIAETIEASGTSEKV